MSSLKNFLTLLTSYAAPAPGYYVPPRPRVIYIRKRRPRGVTVIAVLMIIGGVLLIINAIQMLYFGNLLLPLVSSLGKTFLAIGGIFVILGITYFILARGLLRLKRWAHTGTYALMVISLILNFVVLLLNRLQAVQNAIGILIDFIILLYLTRPRIKIAFGKYVLPNHDGGFTDSDFDF